MKRFTTGLLLLFLLAACSSTLEVQPEPGFTFAVEPGAETVSVTAAEGVSSQQTEGRRTLVPGQDLDIVGASYTFLPGNVLIIEATFENITNQTFGELSFSRAAGSNVVSSTEPDTVAELKPGESTGLLRFEVQHRGQNFTYEVIAEAAVQEPDGAEACVDPVNIPDALLLEGLRDALDKPEGDITCADLAGLTELRIDGDQAPPETFLEDLEGLQYAANLTYLALESHPNLADISLLQNLTKLTFLNLRYNKISDISPVEGLTNLDDLDLGFNAVEDIGPLSNLAKLEILFLTENRVKSIEPLSGLRELNILLLGGNFLTSLRPLVINTGIGDGDDEISLEGNCLDIDPFSQARDDASILEARNRNFENIFFNPQKSFEECEQVLPPPPPAEACADPVNIPDSSVRSGIRRALNLSPDETITCVNLAELITLEAGTIEQFEDSDLPTTISVAENLEGLQYADNLEKISVLPSAEPRADLLAPLSGLENLITLIVSATPLDETPDPPGAVNLEPLSSLTSLERFSLSSAVATDISPLAGLPNLREFGVNSTAVQDYSALQTLPSLRSLRILNAGTSEKRAENAITDISFLEGLNELTSLDLSFNRPEDLSPLADLTNLEFLDLTGNELDDLTQLSSLSNLTTLELGLNKISDITPLAGLTTLEDLDLQVNAISDLSPLTALTNLDYLRLRENLVSDIGALVANEGLGDEEDYRDGINLSDNCLDLSPDSQASRDIAIIEQRNPNRSNVLASDNPNPERCN